MDRLVDDLLVPPGQPARLAQRPTDATLGWHKEAARAELVEVRARLAFWQRRLWAARSAAVLVVLQGRDASGKDGVIRHVMTGMNPAGTMVTSFKVPAGRELDHDYLWRCHLACPPFGTVGVWNRSHYEDVLVVRVKRLVPEERWRRRYRHLREFERMLTDEGTRLVKVHLHVSAEEQRQRLQDRIDDPEEQWKHNPGDLADRALWDEYSAAYEEALTETSTDHAPWYVVPADRKWVRDLAVAQLLLATLVELDPRLPEPDPSLAGTRVT